MPLFSVDVAKKLQQLSDPSAPLTVRQTSVLKAVMDMHVITLQVCDVIFKGAQSGGFLLFFKSFCCLHQCLSVRGTVLHLRLCSHLCNRCVVCSVEGRYNYFYAMCGKMPSLRNKSPWFLQEASALLMSHVWLSGNSIVLPRVRISRGTRQSPWLAVDIAACLVQPQLQQNRPFGSGCPLGCMNHSLSSE